MIEAALLGEVGVSPQEAHWMTLREISAALRGRARAERTRLVTVAQAFGQELSEREARQIIEGGSTSSPTHEAQEKGLRQMMEKHGWGAQDST